MSYSRVKTPLFVIAGLLWGCQAQPAAPAKVPTPEPARDADTADKSDSLRFAEQLVDGLLARTDDSVPASKAESDGPSNAKSAGDGQADAKKTDPAKAETTANEGADGAAAKTESSGEDAPKTVEKDLTPSSPTRACDDLCARGTACVAKLIDAQEKRVRRPSQAKKRLPSNELMCRDDCDDRMERAADRSVIAKQATKCAKAPDCEAFMRCVEEYFEDD